MVAQKEKEKQKEGGPHDARSTLTIKRLTKKFRFLPIHSTASPHFARLPNEILELVFDALDQQGLHATLANFQQSSKHTYAMATPYLFRTIIVSPTTIECLLPLNATVSSGEEDYTMEDLRRYNSIMGHSHLTPRSSDRSDRSNSEDPGSDRDPDESESEDDRSDNEVVKKERPRITPPPSGEITTLNQVGTKATPYELYHAIRSGTKMRGADPNDFSPDDSHVYKAAHLVHVRRIHMAPGLDQGILQRFSGYLRDVTDGIECPMPALQQVCFVPTIWQKTPSQSWRRRSRRRAKLEPTEGPGQFLAIAFRGRKQPKGPHMCFHLSSKTNPEGVKYDGAYFEDITMFKPAPASITFHGVHKQTYYDAMNFANRKVGCHRYIFAKNPNTEKYSPMTSMADVAIEIIHQLSNRQKESVGKRLRLGNFRVEALNVFLTDAEKEKSADVRAAVRAQVEGGQHRVMDNKIISDVLDHFEYEPVLLPGRKLKKKERALWRPCDACGHPP